MTVITPLMTVAEFLRAWPHLEEILVAQAPAFARLRNPVLRRTIARVATLEQAAGVAGISARDLVATLRRAAGQPIDEEAPVGTGGEGRATSCAHPTGPAAPTRPLLDTVVDADELLATGAVPIKAIFALATSLDPGQSFDIVASFRPVPLIERLTAHGFTCEIATAPDGRVAVAVSRPPDGRSPLADRPRPD
jgi:hypothetical protein